ncbi:MAG: DUF1028 domain-containing protein [Betaproteobacteria bacterium]|nr:DUF1028 domain-containing protein [Betaproteobacteria bacterium]
MTFSIVAHCKRTGKIGVAQSTGSPAVGRKAASIIPGKAVILVQGGHNHYLLRLAEGLVHAGYDAQKVIKVIEATANAPGRRQLVVLYASGDVAALTGDGPTPVQWKGHIIGDGVVVAGNRLVSDKVAPAMMKAFADSADKELEERLMRAIEAGRDAGGQNDGQYSSILWVYDKDPYPMYDLRVDMSKDPVGDLRKLFDWYQPLVPYYARCYEGLEVATFHDYLKSINWPTNGVGA